MISIHMDEILYKKAWKIIKRNYGFPGSLYWPKIKENYEYYENLVRENIINDTAENNFYKKTIIDYLGNDRDIYVYDIFTRWAQQVVKLYLQRKTQSLLLRNVYSYRGHKNLVKMRNAMHQYFSKPFLRIDIEKFFSDVDTDLLIEILKNDYAFTDEDVKLLEKFLYPKNQGLPQGNCLSPYLSNLYLSEVDRMFEKDVYFRYSDDIFVMIDGLIFEEVLTSIEKILNKLNLRINWNKTCYIPQLE